MTNEELDEIMLTIEHLWPASKFRDLDEIETWRQHLSHHNGDDVAQVLGILASTGEYRRFRPDLPPILTAVNLHRAGRKHEAAVERDPSPSEPQAPRQEVLEDIARLREKLKTPRPKEPQR